jgi:hypothetical protein
LPGESGTASDSSAAGVESSAGEARPSDRRLAAGADGGPPTSPADEGQSLEQLIREFGTASAGAGGEATSGPLTGAGFGEWADRLRTVEELLEDGGMRQRLAQARFEAEEMRRGHLREARAPQWDLVDMGVVQPLQAARTWVRQELNRREQPDALQPVDRDPVPDRYAEAVRKYYEALGGD